MTPNLRGLPARARNHAASLEKQDNSRVSERPSRRCAGSVLNVAQIRQTH